MVQGEANDRVLTTSFVILKTKAEKENQNDLLWIFSILFCLRV